MSGWLSGVGAGWSGVLSEPGVAGVLGELGGVLERERRAGVEVYPAECEIFAALRRTALERVRVVILGQDPYHDTGQAHGLSFSVPSGQRIPPSLRNIYRELAADLGCSEPRTGCLAGWAEQGVLLLNSVLTVRAHEANSHRGLGWERVTGAILEAVKSGRGSGGAGGSGSERGCVFMAWGGSAERVLGEIPARHLVIRSPHPSPLSAYRGFFGSRPFSRANAFLVSGGGVPIDWTRVD